MLRNPYYLYGATDMVVPARLNFGEFMLQKIISVPEKVVLTDGITEETITYGQVAQETMNLAVSLTHLGLRKGQTVALCSENRFEFWSVVLGVACTGAVLTTINPGYSDGEVRHVLKISKPTYIVLSPNAYKTHGKLFHSSPHIKRIIIFGDQKITNVISYNDIAKSKDGVGDIIVNNKLARNVKYEEFECADVVGQTDTLFVLYSSGTTGLPKGAMLTHLNIIAQCCMPTSEDVDETLLMITPWFHVMGLVGTLLGLASQRRGVFLTKFDVDLYLKTIEKYRIYSISVVPPIIVAISKAQGQYDLSSVKMVHSGAAPLYKETEDLLRAKFPNMRGVFQGYGMTEAGLVVTRNLYRHFDMTRNKEGTVGMPVSGVTIKVVDLKTQKPLGPHQPGEICVKGVVIMKGYLGKDRREDFDEEGFFRTGDIGYYDEDRCFFIVDRLKELIKYKGYQVAPAELEALLLEHNGIRDAGVIGIPDKTAGELPLAFVVKQPGQNVTEKEIQEYVAGKLSNPKHLRGGVRFIDAIPKNPSGKILRKNLREMAKIKKSKL